MIRFTLNGNIVSMDLPGDIPLLWALREYLRLTGTKYGCGIGQCGACTVHVNGSAVRSCTSRLSSVEHADVLTIEGLGGNKPHPLQKHWIDGQVPQCGYCQSGAIMQAADLLKKKPDPGDADIITAMNPVLCRCMTYPKMKAAIKAAALEMNPSAADRPAQRPDAPPAAGGPFQARSSAAGGTVIFGWPPEGRRAGNLWFEMDANGLTTVNITKAEMGQHVGTTLAQTLAEELEVRWEDVRIRHVDTNPKWGPMITGGSWSVHSTFDVLSRAGAAGRIALIRAAATILKADPGRCVAENSKVVDPDSGRSLTYAEIIRHSAVSAEMDADELAGITLKQRAGYKLVGHSPQALDIPAKTNGSAIYGIDVFRPGMAYGRLVTPPVRYGAKVIRVDEAEAQKIPGFLQAVSLDDPTGSVTGFVVCVAETYDAADKAAKSLNVAWDSGPNRDVDSLALANAAEALVENPERWGNWVLEGDAEKKVAGPAKKWTAKYTTSLNLHAPLEPANAIVELIDGSWHAWTGNQNQIAAVPLMARALGVDESKVVIHQHYLGGGFGKRLDSDYIVVAALTAKAVGRPVKVIYTREQDLQFDFPRSPSLQVLHGSLDGDGRLAAVVHDVVAGWPTARVLPDFLAETADKRTTVDSFAVAGADFWYSVPHHRVRAIRHDLAQQAIPPGYLRAVGPGFTTFAVESFMDEMADLAGADPAEFRLKMLDAKGKQAGQAPNSVGGAARLANVLTRVVERSGYGRKALPENTAMGLACSFGQERTMPTWNACVAEVRADPESGRFRVDKLTLVADVGICVNPANTVAQMQGALLWGVSLAIREYASVSKGAIEQKNFHQYKPLRMADIPELAVHLVENDHFPVGTGEPATGVVAPAIANAIARAVGARVRDLPITPEKVRQALIEVNRFYSLY
jgi:CO/xanthine dehydrogenase Mo-binding subunit/aerobic-type carbon monoxide dehydrogenase small subunit (CoxS/CutS family)